MDPILIGLVFAGGACYAAATVACDRSLAEMTPGRTVTAMLSGALATMFLIAAMGYTIWR